MPARYFEQVDAAQAKEHARIVDERGQRPVHAGLFGAGTGGPPGICVVAPDAPGLLAAISAALMLEDLDVTRADAYTRRTPSGQYEAVDLFWVRRAFVESAAPLSEADVPAIASTLTELLSHPGAPSVPARATLAITPGTAETSVRFTENLDSSWLTLELESNDRTGLLLAVTAALFAEGIQIVGSRIRTHGLRVHDRFDLVDADGSAITGTRRQRIELAVLVAVDGPFHGPAGSGRP